MTNSVCTWRPTLLSVRTAVVCSTLLPRLRSKRTSCRLIGVLYHSWAPVPMPVCFCHAELLSSSSWSSSSLPSFIFCCACRPHWRPFLLAYYDLQTFRSMLIYFWWPHYEPQISASCASNCTRKLRWMLQGTGAGTCRKHANLGKLCLAPTTRSN